MPYGNSVKRPLPRQPIDVEILLVERQQATTSPVSISTARTLPSREELAESLPCPLRELLPATVGDADERLQPLEGGERLLSLLLGQAGDRIADHLGLRLSPPDGQAFQRCFRLDVEPYGRHFHPPVTRRV